MKVYVFLFFFFFESVSQMMWNDVKGLMFSQLCMFHVVLEWKLELNLGSVRHICNRSVAQVFVLSWSMM